jgi:hypothetical protein
MKNQSETNDILVIDVKRLTSCKEDMYYIKTGGYSGNAYFWWGKDSRGYTTDIRAAGKYTKEEAESICQRDQDSAYPCEYIDNLIQGQKLIIDSQYVDDSFSLFSATRSTKR